ncbi:GtrA family protein [Okibacterium endophyticum]
MRRLRPLAAQVVRFGLVGAVGLVVDVCLFNLLRATLLAPDEVTGGVMIAKAVSTLVAILVNWVGNRRWVFAAGRTSRPGREGMQFLAASVLGMAVPLMCLWFSRDVLGLTSAVADNIASNVVGLALGSVFRFALYRSWVFSSRGVASIPAREQDVRESVR